MNKKIIVFGIIFFIFICGYGVIAQQPYSLEKSFSMGRFTAELGLRRDQNPDLHLEGLYNYRGRVRVFRGSYEATESDYLGRFSGQMFGNNFFIVLSGRDGKQVIYGQMRLDENNGGFSGTWKGRGTERSGWITGTFLLD